MFYNSAEVIMSWQTIVALAVALPIILLPVLLVWYLSSVRRRSGSPIGDGSENKSNPGRYASSNWRKFNGEQIGTPGSSPQSDSLRN